jgi:hypothetical protein
MVMVSLEKLIVVFSGVRAPRHYRTNERLMGTVICDQSFEFAESNLCSGCCLSRLGWKMIRLKGDGHYDRPKDAGKM